MIITDHDVIYNLLASRLVNRKLAYYVPKQPDWVCPAEVTKNAELSSNFHVFYSVSIVVGDYLFSRKDDEVILIFSLHLSTLVNTSPDKAQSLFLTHPSICCSGSLSSRFRETDHTQGS